MAGTLPKAATNCPRCGDRVTNRYRRWVWCCCGYTAMDSQGHILREEDALMRDAS